MLLLLLATLVAQATAMSITSPTVTATGMMTTTTTHYPEVSLFLPMAGSGNIGASIVTVLPNATVYAIGCLSKEDGATVTGDGSHCGFDPPLNITEGESTLRFTTTAFPKAGDSSTVSSGSGELMTNECHLSGGTRATQATCTSKSAIIGLGNYNVTTILASSEIDYIPVTITAGAEKTRTGNNDPGGASSTSPGGAAIATAAHHIAVFAGLAAVGLI